MVPGLKFSITTSAVAHKRTAVSAPPGSCRWMRMLFLLRLNIGKKPPPAPGKWRVRSPSGGSTLITSAPRSASTRPQAGPMTMWLNSTTRRPSSGSGRVWLMGTDSGCGRPDHRRLADRQVDQCRASGQHDVGVPHPVVVTEVRDGQAAQPGAHEAANLV